MLKNRGDTKPALINMVARYQNQKLVYSTGSKVLPALWDFENQSPTKDKSILKKHPLEKEVLKDTTLILNQHQSSLDEICRTYKVKMTILLYFGSSLTFYIDAYFFLKLHSPKNKLS